MMVNKKYTFADNKKYNPVEIVEKRLGIFIFHQIKIIEINNDVLAIVNQTKMACCTAQFKVRLTAIHFVNVYFRKSFS
jgi:hypothetical protein